MSDSNGEIEYRRKDNSQKEWFKWITRKGYHKPYQTESSWGYDESPEIIASIKRDLENEGMSASEANRTAHAYYAEKTRQSKYVGLFIFGAIGFWITFVIILFIRDSQPTEEQFTVVEHRWEIVQRREDFGEQSDFLWGTHTTIPNQPDAYDIQPASMASSEQRGGCYDAPPNNRLRYMCPSTRYKYWGWKEIADERYEGTGKEIIAPPPLPECTYDGNTPNIGCVRVKNTQTKYVVMIRYDNNDPQKCFVPQSLWESSTQNTLLTGIRYGNRIDCDTLALPTTSQSDT